ncbi:Xylose operon regulatory protein [Anatilimnocola aggregata]|uniref:Xylose operon regulatory protein n=1 Tax=Anatilimnocola aggregata TaxID=2528021 RepID=A0A517YGK6_9BACT|nr:DNA-binding transcriptional regulator [Anatilimnocola aggregata]QDU29349.1 Xylose operon regulatory protein [Anatilimnocola aggregata]
MASSTPSKTNRRPLQVAVLVETSYVFGRRVLAGIVKYQRQHAPWAMLFRPHARGDAPPSWLKRWRGDGIIARCYDQRMADALRATGLPVVDLPYNREGHGLPMLLIDNRPIVAAAFSHLWERSFRSFAYCGLPTGGNSTMEDRCRLFVVEAAKRDCAVDVFAASARHTTAGTWGFDKEQLARWLRRLPKPVAVMACHDPRGQQVLEACQHAGLSVPEEVAVLGVDNDELMCDLCHPPLSSVEVDQRAAGYRAAECLERMMAGGKPPRGAPYVDAPLRIVSRQSTDVLAIDDPEVAAALRIIREQARGPMSVSDLLKAVPVSRSMLERRMKQAIGRTPKAEILRSQLDWIKELLTTTDLPLADIGQRLGSAHHQHLATLFKSKTGMTPGEYRKRYRR